MIGREPGCEKEPSSFGFARWARDGKELAIQRSVVAERKYGEKINPFPSAVHNGRRGAAGMRKERGKGLKPTCSDTEKLHLHIAVTHAALNAYMQQKPQAGGRQKHRRHFHKAQSRRSKVENDEIAALEAALAEGAPPRGSNPLTAAAAGDGQQHAGFAAAKKFDELPISEYSKQGLREAKYVTLTAIQRAALPHALCGRDVLGAAKTGSGAPRLRPWCRPWQLWLVLDPANACARPCAPRLTG